MKRALNKAKSLISIYLDKSLVIILIFILIFSSFNNFIKESKADLDSNELEYHIDVGPVAGTATANYVYVAFFNPSGSGRTALIKRIAIEAYANGTGNYVNLTLRRITAASGGTLISGANIPKKNSDSADSVIEIRYAGPTVTFAGTANSRILNQPMPGAAGHFYSVRDITFGPNDEKLVIQPGEGVAVYQEAAGTTAQIIRVYFEWEEVTTAPSAQNEFLFAFPRVEVGATANYVYNSFFNPAGSQKVAIVKRIWFGAETCDAAAVYTNNIVIIRISAASGGTVISTTDIPKKHTGSANSVMDFRRTGVTVTVVGGTDARLAIVTPCGAAGQPHGFMQINFHDSDEKLILQPGEGIALMSDDAGDVDQLVRMIIEWQEVPNSQAPTSQNEYIWGSSRIEATSTANQVFYAFFNPVGSGRTAVIKRLVIRNDADAAAVYQAITWRRITSASGGIQIAASDIPKKHTGSSNSAMTLLWCGSACGTAITVTFAGSIDSRLLTVNGPGAIGQVIGHREIVFGNNEKLVLQEGQGIALYTEATGDVDQYIKVLIEWQETTNALTAQNEYVIDPGPINGSTAANYVYASFFNPSVSGKTAVIKRISIRVDAAGAAVYIPMTLRRITSAFGGTQILAANIPKKHTGSADPILNVRRTGVTVSFAGSTDSRIVSVTTPGAVGGAAAPSITGYKELLFENDEKLILQPGEGIALYQEAAGNANFRVKILVEWQEVTTTSSQGEYLMSIGPITGSTESGYVYASLFNPSTSNKNYVVKRIEIRANRTGILTSPGYIPATIRRITSASGGTQILPDYIPKKHSGTPTSTAEIRTTNPTVNFAGVTNSRLLGVTVPGAVNQSYGDYEILIVYQDELILKPGEGLALYQEQAAGDTNVVFRFAIEWSEVNLPPSQSAYRFFQNIDSTDVGTPLANQNTPATLSSAGQVFRLRLLIHASSSISSPWINSAVETTNNVGLYTSIDAIDANTIFISHHDNTNGGLRFCKSTNGGSTWTCSAVETINNVGLYTSIDAIDANTIFISHHDLFNGDLRFCKSTNGGSTWTCSAVETEIYVGLYTSIDAIDANTIFISHHDLFNGDLRFCKSTNGGSTWTCSAVETEIYVGLYTSIDAIDANTIFISHHDFTNGDLRFCKSTNGGSTWTCSAVETTNNVGLYTSIDAIDANTIFISHHDNTNGDLRFCKSTNGGSTWTCSAVETINNVGLYTSIDAIDANTIFISHHDNTNGDLRFCKSTNGGSTWTCSAVETTNNVGLYTSIDAIDANTIFISHHDYTNLDLRFAKANFQTFKLQFAQRGADGLCDTSFYGETYTDVTTSTVIAFYDNPTPTDDSPLTANANDPTHGNHTIRNQTYEELNPFTNSVSAINAGEDGKWDFALKDNGAPANTTYCFRVVKADGMLLGSYSVIPEITTAYAGAVTCTLSATLTSFSALSPSAVSTSSPDITITITSGGGFQINVKDAGNGTNPGLYKSSSPTYLIQSRDATLIAGTDGYGIQATTTNSSISINPKYNKSGNNVGGLSLTDIVLATSSVAVSNATINIKHKASVSVLAPTGDYNDTITYTCSSQ
jgi:hypothetical protein